MTHILTKALLALLLAATGPLAYAGNACQNAANILNKRFFSDKECDGQPFYACAGVMLHTLESGAFMAAGVSDKAPDGASCTPNSMEPWCPTPNSSIKREMVSFSFLHQWVTPQYGTPVFPNAEGTAGFIFRPAALSEYLLCAYPVDAMSFARMDCGCGAWGNPVCENLDSTQGTCEQDGVNTSADFFDRYINNVHNWDIKAMCSFGNTPAQFGAFMSTTTMVVNDADRAATWNPYCTPDALSRCPGWNEVVLKSWFNIPFEDIPIEAFFYVTAKDPTLYTNGAQARAIAEKMAKDFPRRVPVVELNIDRLYAGSPPFQCEGSVPERD